MREVKSVLVTGASGFIGRAVCARVAREGWTVRAALRKPQDLPSDVESIVVGEVNGETDWGHALPDIESVVHLAARAHVLREKAADPLAEFRKINTEGTLNLARQAAAAGVGRFVYVSSIGVNGNQTFATPFTEVDELKPHDLYAVSKFEAEQGLHEIAANTGMELVIIRPPLVYGPGVKGNFARLVQWVRKGVPLPFGALQNRRSLLALDNLASFVALCADPAKSPQAANEVFLISDGEDVSTAELIRRVARAYGRKAHLLPVPPAWMRFGARLLGKSAVADRLLGSLVIDSSKARQLLGWRPVVTMDEQLRKMARDAAPV